MSPSTLFVNPQQSVTVSIAASASSPPSSAVSLPVRVSSPLFSLSPSPGQIASGVYTSTMSVQTLSAAGLLLFLPVDCVDFVAWLLGYANFTFLPTSSADSRFNALPVVPSTINVVVKG